MPDYNGEHVYPAYWDWQDAGYSERDLEIAKATYMGEITMVDRWFGLLIDRLKSLGLYDDTAILFVSDHGFYFGEFGIFGKRRFRWPDNTIPVMEAMARFKQGGDLLLVPVSQRADARAAIRQDPRLQSPAGIRDCEYPRYHANHA